jgi:hypothetical protein
MHPQHSSYYVQNNGGGGGGGGGFTGRALDTLEGITGRDARRQLETLAKSKPAAERLFYDTTS